MKLHQTLALALLGACALHQADAQVNVNVSINPPAYFGRVDVGQEPPRLIYPQPVIVQQSPVAMVQRPIYMRVPPDQYLHWSVFCGRYRACGQPVYFVETKPVVIREHDHRHWKDRHEDDEHDDDHDGEHDHGHGHGHGHWKNHHED